MAYKIIERFVLDNGTAIQLEDWRPCNTKEYPNLHGYTIGCYPKAKRTNKWGLIRENETFRLAIEYNPYKNYFNEDVLTDWFKLKNKEVSIEDLHEHFYDRERAEWYLGLNVKEPWNA